MSRIGREPVEIPSGVTVEKSAKVVIVKGPKGELSYETRPEMEVTIKNNLISVEVGRSTKESSAYWGLTRAIIANMVEGVVSGFEKRLKLVGVGYRVKKVSERKISISVGYSHPIEFESPEGVTLVVEDDDTIIVSGIDKQKVGLVAANIRKIRKPEPYKGKGIRYEGEIVKRKPGKTGTVI